jgi:osmoprotectant transport system ATP-binding protein
MNSMISIRHVTKSFRKNAAIDDFSLEIAAGEHVVLLGPSGSGKTTLLRMINGLVTPSSGTVLINGRNIAEQPGNELRRQIGYVLQRNSLFPHYTVEENIGVVPELLGWNNQAIRKRTIELMNKLGLPQEYLSKSPIELSGGEAQRVNLARALAADAPILLMDEPFSSLDIITKRAIREEFIQLDEFQKKTMVMVSHDIREAFELGTTICLLNEGKLIQKGTPAELLYNPVNNFVKDFLSSDYLQLSFGTTSIIDLWDFLSGDDNSEEDSAVGLACDTTLWKAMELIQNKTNDHEIITVRHARTGEWKRTSWGNLLEAYSLFQRHTKR